MGNRRAATDLLLWSAFVSIIPLGGCNSLTTSDQNQDSGWNSFQEEFIEGLFEVDPASAVNAGRHDFDGKLPDWSTEGLARAAAFLKGSRERAEAFEPSRLNEQQQFERDYLVAVADERLFWLETSQAVYRNPTFYADALDPNVYVAREYAPLHQRLHSYIAYAKNLPQAVEQIKANLRTPLPRTHVEIGRTVFGGLVSYFEKDVPGVFKAVEDQALQAAFGEANAGATAAMNGLDAWLGEQGAGVNDDFALGPDLFSEMLYQTERVDVSLDRLEQLGREDLERNMANLEQACAEFAPGKTIAECVARVQSRKPAQGPVAAAREQLGSLKQFVVENDLVSIPGTEEARVAESPPYMRWNAAYIDIPGPLEDNLPSIYYIAPPDPSWTDKERQDYLPGASDLLFISVHEIWPGHFLQYLHSNRSPSTIGRLFVGYGFAEGWAHYVEELVWEAGLNGGDHETRVGQLLNALLRNVRYLSAIGLHTGQMTVEESDQMFREKAFQDPGNARQQAARGTFDPAYLNYTLGKLMIRKLRDDWTSTRGGRQAWREFHNRFLSYGGPPIPLVRRAMLGADSGPVL